MTVDIPPFSYLERYRNEGTRTYSRHAAYTEADAAYRPNTGRPQFALPLFEVPRDRMIVYTANPPDTLADTYLPDDRVIFLIHPQILTAANQDPYVQLTDCICTRQRSLNVAPTSSTRTLSVLDPSCPHAVKVHFPFKISRYGRRMRDEVIGQAIAVSGELEAGIGHLDDRFAFLREVIGVAHQKLTPAADRGENWGYLVRDMTPFPRRSQAVSLVPGFALYGQDYFDPSTPLLLFDLIGDSDPVAWVLDNIMRPIIHHWVNCFLHFGYLLEPHSQNVIFEIDSHGTVLRVIHRDLSVGIDMRRRRDLGLSDHHLNAHNRMETDTFHSITYDGFMGNHFFDRIVGACCETYPGITPEDFMRPCRQTFARLFPDYRRYMAPTVWYFSEQRDRFNKPLYQNTGALPRWRP